jgi:hypothetical protein
LNTCFIRPRIPFRHGKAFLEIIVSMCHFFCFFLSSRWSAGSRSHAEGHQRQTVPLEEHSSNMGNKQCGNPHLCAW